MRPTHAYNVPVESSVRYGDLVRLSLHMSQTIGNTHRQRAVLRAMDPRLFLPWSAAASRDRLSSTLFLAGLLHGIILLGVTFSSEDLPPESSVTSFDVVLVTNEMPD